MIPYEARVKPEHQIRYPELQAHGWYDVVPLWPGLTERMTNLRGERLTRLRVDGVVHTVRNDHFEFRRAHGKTPSG